MHHVVCNDGFRLSVQASSFHFCEPRIDNAEKYVSFECGMPSEAEPLLMPYIQQVGAIWQGWGEWQQDPRESVYEFVPKAILKKIFKKRGGIREHHDWEKGSPESPFANTNDFNVVQAGFIAPQEPRIPCVATSHIKIKDKEMLDNVDKISEFLELIEGTLEENSYEET